MSVVLQQGGVYFRGVATESVGTTLGFPKLIRLVPVFSPPGLAIAAGVPAVLGVTAAVFPVAVPVACIHVGRTWILALLLEGTEGFEVTSHG